MNINKINTIKVTNLLDEVSGYSSTTNEIYPEYSYTNYHGCVTELLSVDELVSLRDYIDQKIKQRVFTKHSQATICSEF